MFHWGGADESPLAPCRNSPPHPISISACSWHARSTKASTARPNSARTGSLSHWVIIRLRRLAILSLLCAPTIPRGGSDNNSSRTIPNVAHVALTIPPLRPARRWPLSQISNSAFGALFLYSACAHRNIPTLIANGVRRLSSCAYRRLSCVAHFLSASGRAGFWQCPSSCLESSTAWLLLPFVARHQLLGNSVHFLPDILLLHQGSQGRRIHGNLHVNYERRFCASELCVRIRISSCVQSFSSFLHPRLQFPPGGPSEFVPAYHAGTFHRPPIVLSWAPIKNNFRSHLGIKTARLDSTQNCSIQKDFLIGPLPWVRWLERVGRRLNRSIARLLHEPVAS